MQRERTEQEKMLPGYELTARDLEEAKRIAEVGRQAFRKSLDESERRRQKRT